MIAFVCPGCRKPLSAKEGLAGKKVKCRACGQVTHVPQTGYPSCRERKTKARSED